MARYLAVESMNTANKIILGLNVLAALGVSAVGAELHNRYGCTKTHLTWTSQDQKIIGSVLLDNYRLKEHEAEFKASMLAMGLEAMVFARWQICGSAYMDQL